MFWPTLIELSDHLSWEQASHMIKTTHDPELIERDLSFSNHHSSPSSPMCRLHGWILSPGRGVLDAMRDFIRRIYTDFKFDPASTTVATPLLQILDQRRAGVRTSLTWRLRVCERWDLPLDMSVVTSRSFPRGKGTFDRGRCVSCMASGIYSRLRMDRISIR